MVKGGGPWWRLSAITDALESMVASITAEYKSLLRNIRPVDDQDLTNSSEFTNKSGGWRVQYLMEEGVWVNSTLSKCPVTASLLRALPVCDCNLGYVYFSVLQPHTTIPSHHGSSNLKRRVHLSLVMSAHHLSKSIITLGGISKAYEAGNAIVFDDSYYQ